MLPRMFLIFLIIGLLDVVMAHRSIAFPVPISTDAACTVGRGRLCPGPCPQRNLRADMVPNNPSVRIQRGGRLTVHILRNNHNGGFMRWSIVNIRDMADKDEHSNSAFLYTCSDRNPTKCEAQYGNRDCRPRRETMYLNHSIDIPRVYADGAYVLGWAWFGGGAPRGVFGDYYDCIYIEIKGGSFKSIHKPQFKPGNATNSL